MQWQVRRAGVMLGWLVGEGRRAPRGGCCGEEGEGLGGGGQFAMGGGCYRVFLEEARADKPPVEEPGLLWRLFFNIPCAQNCLF